jgi:hypothetical protein
MIWFGVLAIALLGGLGLGLNFVCNGRLGFGHWSEMGCKTSLSRAPVLQLA